MRLKLDENLPEAARLAAVALGHDVDTVLDEAIGGASDPEVLAAALVRIGSCSPWTVGSATFAATRQGLIPVSQF